MYADHLNKNRQKTLKTKNEQKTKLSLKQELNPPHFIMLFHYKKEYFLHYIYLIVYSTRWASRGEDQNK